MLMAVEGPYALMVQPDDILISPREVDEHFGTMVCFHSRYALGDSHNYMDKDDFLREMYLDTVGHDEAGLKRYFVKESKAPEGYQLDENAYYFAITEDGQVAVL